VSEVPATQSALEAAGASVTETALVLNDPELTWESYERLGKFIGQMQRSIEWWMADLFIYGEDIFGHRFAQIDEAFGVAPHTLSNRVSVARRIPPSRRRAALNFSIHAEVAYLEPRDRDLWLDRAERGQWTRARLREEMRAARGIGEGQMGDLAVTGKIQDTPHEDPGEEHPTSGMPAARPLGIDGLLGEPVSGPRCACCGQPLPKPLEIIDA
jgi:hypothetical protein